MELIVISDTHNKHKQISIPPGDVLIHCGDFSGQGRPGEVYNFMKWFSSQPHEHKIFISGNHDLSFEKNPGYKKGIVDEFKNLIYLEDSSVVLDGIKFYGSPWQPEFCNWAFNLKRDGRELFNVWRKIPDDTNILITHTPPKGILDKCLYDTLGYPQNAGCELLYERIQNLKLNYHFFGHVHEGYGKDGIYANASSCNLSYEPINPPIILTI